MYKQEFMDLAIEEAIAAYEEDEVPIGCVIVKDNVVLAKAHNQKVKTNDATAHSEVECIKLASQVLNNWHLDDCDLYVTLEPCLMCTGAIINARIENVYFAAKDPKGGALMSNLKIESVRGLNHYPDYAVVVNKDYIKLLKEFFKGKR